MTKIDQNENCRKNKNTKLLTKKDECDIIFKIIGNYKERYAVLVAKKVKGVYKRNDGRWEARYVKGYSENGRAVYGAVYGQTEEEVIEKRNAIYTVTEEEKTQPAKMNLLILGAGSHGHSVKEIAESLRVFQKISFLDDKETGEGIIGKCSDAQKFKDEYPCAIVAIGNNEVRRKYATFLKGCNFLIPSIISPAANISKDAKIGEGVVIMPQSTISNAEIGDFCILASNSLVNYGCEVGEYCHIDCGGIILKGKTIKKGTIIRSGEVI